MSDPTIDALKRLERIGDENSKTNQKLIDSAKLVSAAICKSCALEKGDSVNVSCITPSQIADNRSTVTHYTVDSATVLTIPPSVNAYRPVSASTEAATQFARDLATGNLLGLIEEEMKKRGKRATDGVETLGKIASSLNA